MDIKTYNSNGIEVSPARALVVAGEFQPFICNHIHGAWQSIFANKNADYGTNTWVDLGLRGLFTFIYAKWQRIKNNNSNWDAIIDVYGYYMLSYVYMKVLGYDMSVAGCLEDMDIDDLLEEGKYFFWECAEVDAHYACQWLNSMVLQLEPLCYEKSHRE